MTALWPQIYHLASRSATSPSTCRAACHLMELIITLKLVSHGSIAQAIDGMLSSIDLNGPAILTDSAISFCAVLSDLRRSENPGTSAATSERLLHWFFGRWTPGKVSLEVKSAP